MKIINQLLVYTIYIDQLVFQHNTISNVYHLKVQRGIEEPARTKKKSVHVYYKCIAC